MLHVFTMMYRYCCMEHNFLHSRHFSELLSYHQLHAVDMKTFAEAIQKMKQLQPLFPVTTKVNTIHDAFGAFSPSPPPYDCANDLPEVVDTLWVRLNEHAITSNIRLISAIIPTIVSSFIGLNHSCVSSLSIPFEMYTVFTCDVMLCNLITFIAQSVSTSCISFCFVCYTFRWIDFSWSCRLWK